MRLKRGLCAASAGLLLATQPLTAGDLIPESFLGWFVPVGQTCQASHPITVSVDRIVTADSIQRVTCVQQAIRAPRWLRVSLATVGVDGTEDVVIELAQDGLDMRVFFGDGTSLTWRRCV